MMDPANMPEIDAIDLKILRELQADARIPNMVLAERVGLSPSPCSRRVKLLETRGVIHSYRAILDRKATGLALTVFCAIRVERHSLDNADAFVSAVLRLPEVLACHLVSGDYDYLLEIVAPDMATYEAGVLRQLLAIPEIRDIHTNFAMRTHRSNGPLPMRERQARLQP